MSREPRTSSPPPRRKPVVKAPPGEICPRCGRAAARVVGRSESVPVLYLRCDDCHQMSVAPA